MRHTSRSLRAYPLLSVTAILLAFFLLSGCSGRSDVVAEVAGRKITRADFYKAMLQRFDTSENACLANLDQRKKVVQSLINKQMKLLDAYRNGLDKDSAVVAAANKAEDDAAIQQLYDAEIFEKIVPAQEIRSYYDNLGKEISAHRILIRTPLNADEEQFTRAKILADSLYQNLAYGESFESMARKFSQDSLSAPRGGDLGYVAWGKMPQEFQAAAFSLKAGELSHPIRTSYGYEIIRVDARRETKARGSFEDEKDEIVKQLARVYQAQVLNAASEYMRKVQEENGLQYNYLNIQKIVDRMSDTSVPRNNSMFSDFTSAEKQWIIATTKRDTIRVTDLDQELRRMENAPTRFRDQREITAITEGMVMPVLLTAKAREKGLYDRPAVKKARQIFLEQRMTVMAPYKLVNDRVKVTDSALVAYYNSHPTEFMTDTVARAQEILIEPDPHQGRDKAFAQKLAERAQKGEDFTRLVHKYSDGLSKASPDGIIDPLHPHDYGVLGRTAFAVGEGHITDALELPSGFRIVKMLKITSPRQKSFQEAKDDVVRKYTLWQNSVLSDAWWADMNKRYPAKIDEKALLEVLPPPAKNTKAN